VEPKKKSTSKDLSTKDLSKFWKKDSEKDFAEWLEKTKLQGQIGKELCQLIKIEPKKVQAVLNKYSKTVESILKATPKISEFRSE
jgi:hypothetical protein